MLVHKLTCVMEINACDTSCSFAMQLKARQRATPASFVPSTSSSVLIMNTKPILEKKMNKEGHNYPFKPQ